MRQTHVPSKTQNAAYSGLENKPQKMSRNIYDCIHLSVFICWKFKCTKYAQTVWVNRSENGFHENRDGGKQWAAYFLAWSNAGTCESISLRLSFRLLTLLLFCFILLFHTVKKRRKKRFLVNGTVLSELMWAHLISSLVLMVSEPWPSGVSIFSCIICRTQYLVLMSLLSYWNAWNIHKMKNLHTRELISTQKTSCKHNNKDTSHLQWLPPRMRVNTRYINSIRSASSKSKMKETSMQLDLWLVPAQNVGTYFWQPVFMPAFCMTWVRAG